MSVRPCEDEAIGDLMSYPPDDFDGLTKEGMVVVANTGYRRMMSSVERRSATPLRCIYPTQEPMWRLYRICDVIRKN